MFIATIYLAIYVYCYYILAIYVYCYYILAIYVYCYYILAVIIILNLIFVSKMFIATTIYALYVY